MDWYTDRDNSLVVVSHYYEELENLVDKILILDKGKVVAFGKKEELFQRFCGNAVTILANTKENEQLVRSFEKIESPKHLIAISCKTKETELKLMELLISRNINFKRSTDDIEIMSINAKCEYFRKGE